jgi:hypothetical protein
MEPATQAQKEVEETWGITNDERTRFLVPKTRDPIAGFNPKDWTTLQWLQNLAVPLNLGLLLLPLPGSNSS